MIDEELDKVLKKELDTLLQDILNSHDAARQKASGKTRASFEVKLTEEGGQLWGANYVGVLEKGRRPGKVPFDFKNILLRWAEAKGITFATPSQANTWAYFVSKKIQKEGSSLYRGETTNKTDFTGAIEEFTKRLTKQIAGVYVAEITNNIFTAI